MPVDARMRSVIPRKRATEGTGVIRGPLDGLDGPCPVVRHVLHATTDLTFPTGRTRSRRQSG